MDEWLVANKARRIMDIASEEMAQTVSKSWQEVYRLAFLLFELSLKGDGDGSLNL